jgi:hypothetical protein
MALPTEAQLQPLLDGLAQLSLALRALGLIGPSASSLLTDP